MKVDVFHQKDAPTGLHLFLVVPAGQALANVPLLLGEWKVTGVTLDLCPLNDIDACDDIGDNGWAALGSGFIHRLPKDTAP